MIKTLLFIFKLIFSNCFFLPLWGLGGLVFAQDRIVKVNFETNCFQNSPSLPYNNPFLIEGEVFKDVEYVSVSIFNEHSKKEINSYTWNRHDKNKTETFTITVSPILKSNSKYDFLVSTYKKMSENQKISLAKNLKSRIIFYLKSHFEFDGSKVIIDKPKNVFKGIKQLIEEALTFQKSKNGFSYNAPSDLVLHQLENHRHFRFKRFLRGKKINEKDSVATKLINEKVESMADLIISELTPFFNSDLVQQYNSVFIHSIPTDKEPFSLPINAGMYAWSMNTDVNNVSQQTTDVTFGVGLSFPFIHKTRFKKSKIFDGVAFSMGVLTNPLQDANGRELATPQVELPVYGALGVRLFKIIRINAGTLFVNEKGTQNFNNIEFIPTFGVGLELNLWLGIKK
jgi:hypothetical protein